MPLVLSEAPHRSYLWAYCPTDFESVCGVVYDCATGRVGEEHTTDTELGEHPHPEANRAEWVPLVQVNTTREAGDRDTSEAPEMQRPAVPGDGRQREPGDLRVGQRKRRLEVIGEAGEPRAEDDANAGDVEMAF